LEVWTTWYEARLIGGAEINTIDIECVMIADEIWQQGPRAVNAEIARLIGEHVGHESIDVPRSTLNRDLAGRLIAIIDGPNLPMSDWADAIGMFEQGSLTDRHQAGCLQAALEASDADTRMANYLDVFLTASGEPRRRLISPALAGSRPEFTRRLTAEQDRLIRLIQTEPCAVKWDVLPKLQWR
jgi:hypothetical protein